MFRGVELTKNLDQAKFYYPADVAKPSRVAFVDSYMKELPLDFLTLAGPELKVLRVESCGLESVTIPSGLEELYARDNFIREDIVYENGQWGSLRVLDLSKNEVSDVSQLTRFQQLEELNLSGNNVSDVLDDGNVLDLGKFDGLNKLHMLNLSYNDINYLDNTGNVNLESLEDLDLSHNNILPSDLNIAIFYPFTQLHTLRLNDNCMAQLDYNYLLNIKSIKSVYLNGNNFECGYLDSMLKHLNNNGLETPTGDSNSCSDITVNEFCCTGLLPIKTKFLHDVHETPPEVGEWIRPKEEIDRNPHFGKIEVEQKEVIKIPGFDAASETEIKLPETKPSPKQPCRIVQSDRMPEEDHLVIKMQQKIVVEIPASKSTQDGTTEPTNASTERPCLIDRTQEEAERSLFLMGVVVSLVVAVVVAIVVILVKCSKQKHNYISANKDLSFV